MIRPAAPIQPDEMTQWRRGLGSTEIRQQVLDVESLRRFAAAVGAELDVERSQPPLAHWAFFLEAPDVRSLGPDGHVLRGAGLLPPVRLPRRMFAATQVRVFERLTLGREAELTLSFAGIEHRCNASGDLVFVDVDRHVRQDGVVCVSERQTLVYRDAPPETVPSVSGDATAANTAPVAAGDGSGETEEVWRPSRVDLFRFSAATFNSHRIHYDGPYARDVEGYPDLVVQGPLTAVKLLAFAQRRADLSSAIGRFSIRARAPLFVDREVRFAHGHTPGEVQAIRCDGRVALTCRVASSTD